MSRTIADEGRDLLADVILELVEEGPRGRAWIERSLGWAQVPTLLRLFVRVPSRDREKALLDQALAHGIAEGLLARHGGRFRATPEGRKWAALQGGGTTVDRILAETDAVRNAACLCETLEQTGPAPPDTLDESDTCIRTALQQGWVSLDENGRLRVTRWGRTEGRDLRRAWDQVPSTSFS